MRPAMCAISVSGAVEATDGMLWCSATQKRRKPSSSARRASAVVPASACAALWPAPTRMRLVCAATWAISVSGDVDAIEGLLWCSAIQKRAKPSSSARRASAVVPASACAAERPAANGDRSRTERGGAT